MSKLLRDGSSHLIRFCLVVSLKFDSNVLMLPSKNFPRIQRKRGEKKSHCLLLLSIHTTKANTSQGSRYSALHNKAAATRKGLALGTAPEGKCFLERTHCCCIWVFRLPILCWNACSSPGAGMGHLCHLCYLTVVVLVV